MRELTEYWNNGKKEYWVNIKEPDFLNPVFQHSIVLFFFSQPF
jgi:hypothetical protein